MVLGSRSSFLALGAQIRPSLRSDSDIKVFFDCHCDINGSAVGWICTKHGLPK